MSRAVVAYSWTTLAQKFIRSGSSGMRTTLDGYGWVNRFTNPMTRRIHVAAIRPSAEFDRLTDQVQRGASPARRARSMYHVAAALRLALTRSATSAEQARRDVGAWTEALVDEGCPPSTRLDAMIIVTELVANVIHHTQSESVVAGVFDDYRLRLEVHDGDARLPVRRRPNAGGGFGLSIVDALADRWGYEPTTNGKRVWVEMLC
jgi:anti-sigma regulatory factor (Ser/Thr protein kinase)